MPKKSLNFLVVFISLLLIGLLSIKIYLLKQSQSADIFVINPPTIESGNTTIAGTLLKDMPTGQAGKYILILEGGTPVVLDIDGLDTLLTMKVSVTGFLYPATESNPHMTMEVKKITLE